MPDRHTTTELQPLPFLFCVEMSLLSFPRLTSTMKTCCLNLPVAVVRGMYHHTQLPNIILAKKKKKERLEYFMLLSKKWFALYLRHLNYKKLPNSSIPAATS